MGRRRGALALVPLAGVAGLLALGTGAAGAADLSQNAALTFTNFDGAQVTCRTASAQTFDPERRVAYADTFVGGEDQYDDECNRTGFVVIDATFVTRGHKEVTSSVAGYGEALGSWEPVVDGLRTRHRIVFEFCDWNASPQGCELELTLVQPK